MLLEARTFDSSTGLASYSCCNKVPQLEDLKQQKVILLHFWRLEAPHRGVSKGHSFWSLWNGNLFLASLSASGSYEQSLPSSSSLACSYITQSLPLSLLRIFFLCVRLGLFL